MKKPVKASKVRRIAEIKELFDPKAAHRWERDWQNALIDLEEKVGEHFKYAREIYLLQDDGTRKAIDLMVETMTRMAGEPVFHFQGKSVVVDGDRLRKVQEQNLYWIATRILVACAEFDIQIASFRLPVGKCARCLKPKKRRR
jgi:hypothetical protein